MNGVNKIDNLYLKSLLDISDKDEETTSELLKSEGIDPEHLVNDTLRKINSYEFELTKKVALQKQTELLEKITNKIADLVQRVPERVTEAINSLIHPRVPAYRFKPANYTSDISEIFELIDPVLLLEKLEAIEQELS